jgi:predicted restriction endonuclease
MRRLVSLGFKVVKMDRSAWVEQEEIEELQQALDQSGAFDITNTNDGRERALRSLALRRGQPQFRDALLQAYGSACAVTGTSLPSVLEAAHIIPYNGPATNHVCNGLLLRSDIHDLFDLRLLSINPDTFYIYCSDKIRQEGVYAALHGTILRLPAAKNKHPSPDALRVHFDNRLA